MGDHREVGEMALYARVQDDGGLGVAERRPVLVQQLHQLLGHHSRYINVSLNRGKVCVFCKCSYRIIKGYSMLNLLLIKKNKK